MRTISLAFSKEAVTQVQKTGRICILDLELNGVRNIKKSHLAAKFIMIRAPSIKELVSVRKRTESPLATYFRKTAFENAAPKVKSRSAND